MEWQASADLSDIIAACALLLSIVVAIASHRISKKQGALTEEQARLNRLLLARAEQEAVEVQKAWVSANLINKGGNYVVRVFNRGPATARNVDVVVPDGVNHVLSESVIRDKFPMEVMETGQSVDLHARVYMGIRASKFPVTITWADAHHDINTNEVFLTL